MADFGFECRSMMRAASHGALASLDPESGFPFASLVEFATAMDGAPLLLLSDLAIHTQNLKADDRVSLLIRDAGAQPSDDALLASDRLTVVGRIRRCDDDDARRRYLAHRPRSSQFAGFSDFALYRLEPEVLHRVAGFGRIVTRPASEILVPGDLAAEFTAAKDGIIGHMNADHPDALCRYAEALGGDGGHWRLAACDPDGADLVTDMAGQDKPAGLRLAFAEPARSVGDVRLRFRALSETLR